VWAHFVERRFNGQESDPQRCGGQHLGVKKDDANRQ